MITTNKSKQDPLKEIRAIKASLRDPGKLMLDLRADKLTKYLDYRLAQLVNRRIALLPGEQRYLLSETGPGHLRFDPEILDIVAPGTLLTSENALYNERQIEEVITIKRDIEKHLDEALNRPELQDMIKEGLELHLGDLIIESRDPLILSGDMEGRTMILFFYNNEWLMPNNSLIDDLKYAYHRNAYPVFIARKIHGILYPYFKALGIQGFNLYSALLPNTDLRQYTKLNQSLRIYEDVIYAKIDSSYQARVASIDLFSVEGAPVNRFLENIPMNVSISEFLAQFKTSKHSFAGQIEALSNKKVKQALLKTVEKRTLMTTRLGRKIQR